jgi:Cd2+/Zn2+-exporting ATPase
MLKKYKLKNIDCDACAARIEKSLSKLDSVKDISINPANGMMYLDSDNIEEVKKEIKKMEPEVSFGEQELENKKGNHGSLNVKREIILISIVIVLFVIGLLFEDDLHKTSMHYVEYMIFLSAYLISGWGVLTKAVKNITKGKIFDENFLMSVATIGAIAIHELSEAVAVMVFYNVGEFIQNVAVKSSRRSIKSLLEIRPDYANLKINENVKIVSPEDVNVGELIIVKPGEKIPLDGVVSEGFSYVDTYALTGETVPKSIKQNDRVLAGMINKSGMLTVRVEKTFGESSISKILDLIEKAGVKKSQTEKFITTFARFYTPVVVALALMISLLPPLLFSGQRFSDWIYRALVILVISCPCALVISIPLGYFGGIGRASRKGVLIKGSNYLDALTKVKTVVFDKTGTLTKGVFNVSEVIASNGISKEDLLKYAAIAEAQSNHPIADSIRKAYGSRIDSSIIRKYEEISGLGVKVVADDKTIVAGNDLILHKENIKHDLCIIEGTVVHVAVNNKYAGYITISDELKEDSVETMNSLKKLGVHKTIMLTGDNSHSAKLFADKLGIDSYYAELLPEDKVEYMENILNESPKEGRVAFVGDGINDAPVIARSDIGIAMGGLGSDAAVEAADVVIMEDHPSKVAEAIEIAKRTRSIVWQNILFAIGVKIFFISLGGLGIASMWEAVFADMGVALIAILNAARMLRE